MRLTQIHAHLGVYYINAIYKEPQEYFLSEAETKKYFSDSWQLEKISYNELGPGYIVINNFWTKNEAIGPYDIDTLNNKITELQNVSGLTANDDFNAYINYENTISSLMKERVTQFDEFGIELIKVFDVKLNSVYDSCIELVEDISREFKYN